MSLAKKRHFVRVQPSHRKKCHGLLVGFCLRVSVLQYCAKTVVDKDYYHTVTKIQRLGA